MYHFIKVAEMYMEPHQNKWDVGSYQASGVFIINQPDTVIELAIVDISSGTVFISPVPSQCLGRVKEMVREDAIREVASLIKGLEKKINNLSDACTATLSKPISLPSLNQPSFGISEDTLLKAMAVAKDSDHIKDILK